MIADLREYDQRAIIDTDVCVIGAGAAGITITRQLMAKGLRVCLLESGGFEFDEATQQLYDAENVGRPRQSHTKSRLRFLGGTTNHWTGICAPLDEDDFTEKPWVPFSGWPITRSELDPYYARAFDLCGLVHSVFDGQLWARVGRKPVPISSSRLKEFFLHYSPAVRFGRAHREELERSEKTLLLLHANAINIQPAENGSHITHVDVRSLEGREGQVGARVYVLSCGAIENARLLLLSDRVTQGGLGNRRDVVGRFFLDHPFGKCADIVQSGHVPLHELYTDFRHDGVRYRHGFALSPEVRRSEQVLNVGAHLWRSFDTESLGTGAARQILRDLWGGRRSPELGREVEEVIADLDHMLIDVGRRVTGDERGLADRPRLELMCSLEQAPNPDSRISLGPLRDALGSRQARVDWRLSEVDRRTLAVLTRTLALEFGRLNLGRLRIPDWLRDGGDDWDRDLSDYNHHMGTTRMSSVPDKGVVNADCRLHEVDNLYVAGSSVFPTPGHVNPTLTIVALALRLADEIERVLLG